MPGASHALRDHDVQQHASPHAPDDRSPVPAADPTYGGRVSPQLGLPRPLAHTELLAWVRRELRRARKRLPPVALRVLGVVLTSMDFATGVCALSRESLRARVRCSRSQLFVALATLEGHEVLERRGHDPHFEACTHTIVKGWRGFHACNRMAAAARRAGTPFTCAAHHGFGLLAWLPPTAEALEKALQDCAPARYPTKVDRTPTGGARRTGVQESDRTPYPSSPLSETEPLGSVSSPNHRPGARARESRAAEDDARTASTTPAHAGAADRASAPASAPPPAMAPESGIGGAGFVPTSPTPAAPADVAAAHDALVHALVAPTLPEARACHDGEPGGRSVCGTCERCVRAPPLEPEGTFRELHDAARADGVSGALARRRLARELDEQRARDVARRQAEQAAALERFDPTPPEPDPHVQVVDETTLARLALEGQIGESLERVKRARELFFRSMGSPAHAEAAARFELASGEHARLSAALARARERETATLRARRAGGAS